ncbi:MAG: hypothetical protein V1797_15735 [Pseudomonadota bacterium]
MTELTCGRSRPAPAGLPANPLDDPNLRRRMEELEGEIAELAVRQEECAAEVRDLLAREAAGEGPFAGRIHALKQRRMVLATEVQHRKVRINALLLGA